MDVFVQSSLRDGLPNALLEAMACGRAVVCTRVGGIPDAITDGVNGRLAPADKIEGLSNAIDELMMDADLLMRLGRAACQTIKNQFTPQAELDGNPTVYRELGLRS